MPPVFKLRYPNAHFLEWKKFCSAHMQGSVFMFGPAIKDEQVIKLDAQARNIFWQNFPCVVLVSLGWRRGGHGAR
jgi:hypothetical protein